MASAIASSIDDSSGEYCLCLRHTYKAVYLIYTYIYIQIHTYNN